MKPFSSVKWARLTLGVALAALLTSPALAEVAARSQPFDAWLEDLKSEARGRGVSNATLEAAFRQAEPIGRVIELDRRQPEFTLSFWRYMNNAVSETRVERGRALLREHAELLAEVEARYGVQPRFLVAFWGLETNYGDTFGNFPVIGALSTLAYDTRRSDFFRKELLTALGILEAGDIAPDRMEGSWAGAMGHLQFMPTTFAAYAADYDGDGQRDIWGSLPDVFASASNYLSSIGWKGDQTWGREVVLPAGFDYALVSIATTPEIRKSLTQWAELGVRRADGGPLPADDDIEAALILPAGGEGPAFLVYDNYRRILSWNRSILYAVAVGHLADRLVGKPPLSVAPPAGETRLSREEVKEIQRLLGDLGFNPGGADGRVGPRTRDAIRAYQKSAGLVPDAYASPRLLASLRQNAAR